MLHLAKYRKQSPKKTHITDKLCRQRTCALITSLPSIPPSALHISAVLTCIHTELSPSLSLTVCRTALHAMPWSSFSFCRRSVASITGIGTFEARRRAQGLYWCMDIIAIAKSSYGRMRNRGRACDTCEMRRWSAIDRKERVRRILISRGDELRSWCMWGWW